MFLIEMIKDLTRGNLKEKGLLSAHSLEAGRGASGSVEVEV